MLVKQILIAFWWIIAIVVIVVSGFKINSLKFEIKPEDRIDEIALIIDRIVSLDMKVEVYYRITEGEIMLSENEVKFVNNGIVVKRAEFSNKDNLNVEKKEGELIIKKNE